jgi:hypothetical protein
LKKQTKTKPLKQCDICGGMYHNVGAHKNKAHKEGIRLVVDEYTEETLSSLLSKIKQLLRNYRSEIVTKTIELGGVIETVEINAKIHINR